MELKSLRAGCFYIFLPLLIELYGIEISLASVLQQTIKLLIELYGIEISLS